MKRTGPHADPLVWAARLHWLAARSLEEQLHRGAIYRILWNRARCEAKGTIPIESSNFGPAPIPPGR